MSALIALMQAHAVPVAAVVIGVVWTGLSTLAVLMIRGG